MTLTRKEIIEEVYANVGVESKYAAAKIVDGIFEILKETMERGERIKISGFGNFNISHKTSRPGRNPKTGESVTIEARRIVSFKPSQILRDAVNK